MDNLVVLIPIYKNALSKQDRTSLFFCKKYLYKYKIVIISPEKLADDPKYIQMLEYYNFEAKYFQNKFFSNISGYNKLMLNLNFYESFSKYKYMLIYQLDALVFSSDLSYWMNKDYDYIGAPWVTHDGDVIVDSMGNGGLSLRKTSKFIDVLKSKEFVFSETKFFETSLRAGLKKLFFLRLLGKLNHFKRLVNFRALFLVCYFDNEDLFWSFYAKFFVEKFKLSTVNDALKFSFEENPEFCFEKNNNEFPFGCHAWEKYDLDFWIKNVSDLSQTLNEDHVLN